ncbi:unnamed protein product [Brassica oleracea var. botrytis]
MATKKTILKRLLCLKFLATVWVVEGDFSIRGSVNLLILTTMPCIPTISDENRDEVGSFPSWKSVLSTADNIRRTLQDVNLGCDDAPFVLPSEVDR